MGRNWDVGGIDPGGYVCDQGDEHGMETSIDTVFKGSQSALQFTMLQSTDSLSTY